MYRSIIVAVAIFFGSCMCNQAILAAQTDDCSLIKQQYKNITPVLDSLKKKRNIDKRDSIYNDYIKRIDLVCPCDYWAVANLHFAKFSFTFFTLGKRKEALEMFATKIEECTNKNDSTTLFLLYKKGLYHLMNNDFRGMKLHLEQAISMGGKKFENNYRDLFVARINLGLYYNWKNDYHTALQKYKENEDLLGDLPMIDTSAHIDNLISLISMAKKIKNHDVAQQYKTKLLSLTASSRFEKNVIADLEEISFQTHVGNNEYNLAAAFQSSIEKKFSQSYHDLGIIYISFLRNTGQLEKAKKYTGIMDSLLNNEKLPKHQMYWVNLNLERLRLGIDNQQNGVPLHFSITESLHNNYINLVNEGIIDLTSNISLITSKYLAVVNELNRTSKISEITDVYDKMNNLKNISSSYYLKRQYYIDNSKDETLKADFKKYKALTASLLKNADSKILLDTINFLSKQLQQKLDAYNMKWHTNTSIKDIQRKLDKNDIFLDYYQPFDLNSDSALYLFIVTKDTCYFKKYHQLWDTLALQDFGSNYTNNGKKNKALYQYLIQPLESYFANKKRIYISPDGLLNQIAIELLSPTGTKAQMIEEKFEIIYVENASGLLAMTKTTATNPMQSYLLAGGIQYNCIGNSRKDIYQLNGQVSDRSQLEYLPGSRREVDSIASKLLHRNIKFDLITDCNATVTNLVSAIEQRDIANLHISTHGNLDINVQGGNNYLLKHLESQLILADDSATGLSGILSALEVLDLDLDEKELVFLSACNTGKGNYLPGLGNASIANAFKKAGAKKVIATLWPIPDDVTVELCDHFYTHYLTHQDANAAMRHAKSILRSKYSPEQWAAFRVMN